MWFRDFGYYFTCNVADCVPSHLRRIRICLIAKVTFFWRCDFNLALLIKNKWNQSAQLLKYVLVQVVKMLLGKMCIPNKLLKWLLMKMCVSKKMWNWKDVLAKRRHNANVCYLKGSLIWKEVLFGKARYSKRCVIQKGVLLKRRVIEKVCHPKCVLFY